MSGQGLLYAAFILWATTDVAVVGVFEDDLILPVHRCETRNVCFRPTISKKDGDPAKVKHFNF